MKANRAFRANDSGGPEIIGAIILFGLFVTILALLNITAVPAAGLGAEEEHYTRTLSNFNALQSQAEVAGLPGSIGATVGQSIDLGPARSVPKDFFSYFLATPAQASGQLTFAVNHGNVTVTHYKGGSPNAIVDIGNEAAPFPYGKVRFDPHPIFRASGIVQLEDGGIVTTGAGTPTMRFAPPVSVTLAGSSTIVSVHVRVLNGSDLDMGGVAPVRLQLVTQAATLSSPASDNARNATLRIETEYGEAWGSYLNQTSAGAGLAQGSGFATSVAKGAGTGGLDVVTWTVEGLSAGSSNDVRLTTALAVYGVSVS